MISDTFSLREGVFFVLVMRKVMISYFGSLTSSVGEFKLKQFHSESIEEKEATAKEI